MHPGFASFKNFCFAAGVLFRNEFGVRQRLVDRADLLFGLDTSPDDRKEGRTKNGSNTKSHKNHIESLCESLETIGLWMINGPLWYCF